MGLKINIGYDYVSIVLPLENGKFKVVKFDTDKKALDVQSKLEDDSIALDKIDLFSLHASGVATEYIRSKVTGIPFPVTTFKRTVWRGKDAVFIIENIFDLELH